MCVCVCVCLKLFEYVAIYRIFLDTWSVQTIDNRSKRVSRFS